MRSRRSNAEENEVIEIVEEEVQVLEKVILVAESDDEWNGDEREFEVEEKEEEGEVEYEYEMEYD